MNCSIASLDCLRKLITQYPSSLQRSADTQCSHGEALVFNCGKQAEALRYQVGSLFAEPRSCRDVTPYTKAHAAVLRFRVGPTFQHATLATQFGSGLHNGSPEITHMPQIALRGLVGVARAKRLSPAILFVDTRATFDTIARQVVLPARGNQVFRARPIEVGLPVDIADEIASLSGGYGYWASTDGSTHHFKLLIGIHECARSNFENVVLFCLTKLRKLAGTTRADLAYTLYMRNFLITARAGLASEGLGLTDLCPPFRVSFGRRFCLGRVLCR